MRGRKPKPVELRVLQGNPGHRPIPTNTPKPKPKAPPCPAFLDDVAKTEWKRAGRELERLGLLTGLDMVAFAAYCQLYSRWKACEDIIREKGITDTISRLDKEGNEVTLFDQTRPEVVIARQSLQLIKVYCAEFGLTPSSRARITLPGAKDEDPDGVLS